MALDYRPALVARFGRYSAWLFVLALSSGFPATALADNDRDRAAARSAAEAGAEAFEQGRFTDALELFSRAEQLVHAPTHLLFIARSQEKLGKLVDARESYLKIVREKLAAGAPTAFKRAQSDAESEINAIEGRLARATVTIRGDDAANAVLSMDNADLPPAMIGIPFPIDPGTHVFAARSPRAKSKDVGVTFRDGERQSVVIDLTEPLAAGDKPPVVQDTLERPVPPAREGDVVITPHSATTQRVLGFVAVGVGVAAGGVGTYFMLKSKDARDKADSEFSACNGKCLPDEKESILAHDADADRARNWGIASFVTSGVGLAAGVILITTAHDGPASSALAPRVGPFKNVRVSAGFASFAASAQF